MRAIDIHIRLIRGAKLVTVIAEREIGLAKVLVRSELLVRPKLVRFVHQGALRYRIGAQWTLVSRQIGRNALREVQWIRVHSVRASVR